MEESKPVEFVGTLTEIHAEKNGTGANGPWKKQTFLVLQPGKYPKPVCITAWGDACDLLEAKLNQKVTVLTNVDSKESNGYWNNYIKFWKFKEEKKEFKGEEKEKVKVITEKLGLENDEDSELPF